MSERMIPDLSGLGGMLETMLATQRKFAPSGQVMAQASEAIRTITQAQMAYSQTVMRANAALISAMWEACTASAMRKTDADSGKASHQTDTKTP